MKSRLEGLYTMYATCHSRKFHHNGPREKLNSL